MAKRSASKGKKPERAPLDWYKEHPRAVEQLFHAINFGTDVIWDGCCGSGNILDVARHYGHPTFGSDLADRRPDHPMVVSDILKTHRLPFKMPEGRALSYVSNPPYGYVKDIAEHIIRHVLTTFNPRRAAFMVPIAFLASHGRHRLFTRDFRPSHVCIHSDRQTCPPGHLIDQMDSPYDGGMEDYVWIVFTRPHRWRTETVWLTPGRHPSPPRWPESKGAEHG